jgi:phytoene/squalene synthetase
LLWVLIDYRRLLERVERAGCEVLDRRVAVPAWEKCWVVVSILTRRRSRQAV